MIQYHKVFKPIINHYKSLAISSAIVSGSLYSLWLLGYFLNPKIMNRIDLSALQAVGQPHYIFFIWGDVLTGVSCLFLVYFIGRIIHSANRLNNISAWLCLVGLVMFGVFTAVSCLLPSCIASSLACNAYASNVLDFHDLTGVVASFGLFISFITAIKLNYRSIRRNLQKLYLGLLISWSASALLFVILSIKLIWFSLVIQQVFLILSSLCLVAIAFIISTNDMVNKDHR